MTPTTFSLYELNSMVRQAIDQTMSNEYWVEAELSECRVNRGHCYMELVQKDEHSNTPIARAQARCWQNTWSLLEPYFEQATGQKFHAGLKTRLRVYPQFHETYGFSWIVTDIDPTFTLGDMASSHSPRRGILLCTTTSASRVRSAICSRRVSP